MLSVANDPEWREGRRKSLTPFEPFVVQGDAAPALPESE